MDKKYDYLVIGAGPAGHVSAIRAAQLGLKVVVIEKDSEMVGGVCLNEGCIPAKSLYRSADEFNIIRKGAEICGIDAGNVSADLAFFVKKSRDAVRRLSAGLQFLFEKNKIDLVIGEAKFTDNGTVEVNSGKIQAGKILIATGSSPRSLPFADFDGKVVLSSSDAIRLEEVPGKVLIIGGGAIGTEFASYFNLVGSSVTIVEMEETLLPGEDREVSKRLANIFRKSGIEVVVPGEVKDIKVSGKTAEVQVGDNKDIYDKVIVSIGRVPNTSGLDLDKAGVKTDEGGFIEVDGNLKTSSGNIYAAGDVVKTNMLAHMAEAEGRAAADAASGNPGGSIDPTSVPYAVYSHVQVASVGITEEEAKEKGLDYSVGRQFFKASGKALINGETDGFMKVIADSKTRKILGAHIIGHEATELIHEFVLAKRKGLTVDDIADTVHAHPTLSETAIGACRSVFDKPIHG